MKLRRADGMSLVAIACGAVMAIGLTSLIAASGHHDRHEFHFEHVDEVVVGHKDVRVRIESGYDAEGEIEVTVEHSDGSAEAGARPTVQVDGGVRIVRSDGADETSGPQPLIYVDGVRMEGDRESVLDGIDPDNIDRIEVVKGEAAMRLFGDDATGGVIQIFLKDIGAAHPGG